MTSLDITTISSAIRAFITSIKNSSVVLPGDLLDVSADTRIQWPFSMIYNKKVIPINYNADTNTITLAT